MSNHKHLQLVYVALSKKKSKPLESDESKPAA